jgi:UDP-N-acetylglucosamine transferase subunit ALG13
MIFATVGMEMFPFDRFVKALDEAKGCGRLEEEVFFQIGFSVYEPKHCIWTRFVEFEKNIELLKKSRVIVAHAGVGSTLMCLNLGKVPILFPRLYRYSEHVDDHQLEFAKRMDSDRKVIVAYENQELILSIRDYDRLLLNLRSNAVVGPRLTDYLEDLLTRRNWSKN